MTSADRVGVPATWPSPSAPVAIGYRRVSSRDQLDGYSMEGQEQAISSWCQSHHLPLERVFGDADASESGKNLERPAFLGLLRRIADGGVGWVVVTKVDRLTRSMSDMSRIIEEWDRLGIRMVFCQEPFPTDGSSNATLILLFTWLAEHERRRIVGRVVPGLQARVRAGLPPTRIAFGYRVDHVPTPGGRSRHVLQVDQDAAPVVRAIFAQAAETEWGARRLAQWATTQFRPRTFSYGAVATMLRNPIYCGVLQAQVAGTVVRLPDNHEPMIELSLFLAVQARLRQRSADHHVGVRADASSLLGGIARCGQCGRAMVLHGRVSVPDEADTYVCASALTTSPCGLPAHPVRALDAFAYQQMLSHVEHHWQLLSGLVTGGVERIPEFLDQRRERAVLLRDEVLRERSRFVQRIEDGELTPDSLVVERTRLARQEAEASALLAQIDGWSYLVHLVGAQSGHDAGLPGRPTGPVSMRFLPLPLAWASLQQSERRRFIKACTTRLVICAEEPFVAASFHESPAAWTLLEQGIARHLALSGGIPLPRELSTTFTLRPGSG